MHGYVLGMYVGVWTTTWCFPTSRTAAFSHNVGHVSMRFIKMYSTKNHRGERWTSPIGLSHPALEPKQDWPLQHSPVLLFCQTQPEMPHVLGLTPLPLGDNTQAQ